MYHNQHHKYNIMHAQFIPKSPKTHKSSQVKQVFTSNSNKSQVSETFTTAKIITSNDRESQVTQVFTGTAESTRYHSFTCAPKTSTNMTYTPTSKHHN